MEVWVLTLGAYSDATIYGVFTSLDKAKEAADKIVKAGDGSYCADIAAYDVDSEWRGYSNAQKFVSGERIGDWDKSVDPEKFYIKWEDDDND